jgi:hypothetical protein
MWPYRVSAYRIIHERHNATAVRVVSIRHRGQAYDTDPRTDPRQEDHLSTLCRSARGPSSSRRPVSWNATPSTAVPWQSALKKGP